MVARTALAYASMGTPSGVGYPRTPPVFMKHGDVVEIEIEDIGILRNPIVDEALQGKEARHAIP